MLPLDILRLIIDFLDWRTLLQFQQATKRFRSIVAEQDIWTKRINHCFEGLTISSERRDVVFLFKYFRRLNLIYQDFPKYFDQKTCPHYLNSYLQILPEECLGLLRHPRPAMPETELKSPKGVLKSQRRTFMIHLRKEIDSLSRVLIRYLHRRLPEKPQVLPLALLKDEFDFLKSRTSYRGKNSTAILELIQKYHLKTGTLYELTVKDKNYCLFLWAGCLKLHRMNSNLKSYPREINQYLEEYSLYPRDARRFFGLE